MPLGLSQTEAAAKLAEYGYNEIVDKTKVTPLDIFLRQVKKNYILYLLLFAAIISFAVGKGFTGYTIIAVMVTVVITGFIQEFKAEKSISELKKMIMPITIVYRDGKKVELSSRELVPGDVLVLGNGEKIPADCVLLEAYELRVNEAALTGESKEINKKVKLSDEDDENTNKIYMGTYIVNGRGVAEVVHTGMNTKFGEIAHLISSAEKDLPLQDKINAITKYMVTIAIVMSAATGGIMLLRAESLNAATLIEILILSIAIAVSAFPEGLPVVLISTLAVGAKRMSEKDAIVNRMSIIETLGETTVVCSDKTGTITRGEMTVKFVFTGNALYEVEGSGYVAHGQILKNDKPVDITNNEDLRLLIESGIKCTDSEIERLGTDNEYKAQGSPTEAALLILGAKVGAFKELLNSERTNEKPFSSDRKMMSVLHEENGRKFVFAKGAPEVLINRCTHLLQDSKKVELGKDARQALEKMQDEMADGAYRTLVVAYKELNSKDDDYEEDGFIFLGLVAMEDPPREEVENSIKLAHSAGIRVIMITGDNKNTAMSIAKQIDLGADVMTGAELDDLSDEELKLAVNKITIFARVRPEHKIRIVEALKENGEIVAMTGDGVNDAPALKEAHIGVAMGKNGTDVSRSVSDLVLKSDNFATIIDAISEGRTIFNNLRKFITYQLSCNFAELVTLFIGVLFAPLLGWEVPLLVSIQILFMNLVTDNLPAITLGLNPHSADIMTKTPRKGTKILTSVLIKVIIFTGLLMAVLTLMSFFLSYNIVGNSTEISRTLALATLIMLEIGIAFSFRSFRKTTLDRSPFVNKYLVYASIASFVLTLVIIYTPLNKYFETVPIPAYKWTIAVGLMFVGISLHDIFKRISMRKPEYQNSIS